MNDNKNKSRFSGMNRRTSRTQPEIPESAAGEPEEVAVISRPRGRHAAITDPLYNVQSYKSWVERMKRDFEEKK